ncbi:MAG: DUF1080 domain-containing protein [Thermoguttaceae bacterium]|nr:DUF1080 domain-containing protein [Thermoguttaceae bacterium]MDW8037562.1 DUF1080 domain-containing protein [Thermoguttaceae bacterium]
MKQVGWIGFCLAGGLATLGAGMAAVWAAESAKKIPAASHNASTDKVSSSQTTVGLTPEEIQEGFVSLFDGKTLKGWQGDTKGYVVENGLLVCKPGGNLYTEKEYADFIFRFEFRLTPGANNGVGIRAELGKNAAYHGMEIQILDDSAPRWANLQPYQYHGSIYGVVPAKRGHLNPPGQWNSQEIYAKGPHIRVTLNGVVIVDADISKIDPNNTMDHQPHPGLHNKKGYIGFLGHGSRVEFRNIRIKEL